MKTFRNTQFLCKHDLLVFQAEHEYLSIPINVQRFLFFIHKKLIQHAVSLFSNLIYLPSLTVHSSNLNHSLRKLKLKCQSGPLQKLDGSEPEQQTGALFPFSITKQPVIILKRSTKKHMLFFSNIDGATDPPSQRLFSFHHWLWTNINLCLVTRQFLFFGELTEVKGGLKFLARICYCCV